MTALSKPRDTHQYSAKSLYDAICVPMAASTTIYAGGIVVINASGYAAPAGSTGNIIGARVVGVAEETLTNSGAAGAIKIRVRRGTFRFANSLSFDAIAAVHRHQAAYVVDDNTLARTSSGGARTYAGRIVDVDADGVWAELGIWEESGTVDLPFIAGADLSLSQHLAVKLNNSGEVVVCGAGEAAVGVLQNAPASGAVAVVRVSGRSMLISGGTISNAGTLIAANASGKAKAAVASTTNTSDAGVAADPLVGSHVLGINLAAGATDVAMPILILHAGAVPSTAA